MTNKQVHEALALKYLDICMVGGVKGFSNPITMHHIEPKHDGGLTTIANGSLVAHLEHSGLHILMDDDRYKKRQIIDYLKTYKDMLEHNKDPFYMKVEFHKWMEQHIEEMGYVQDRTNDGLLIYRKSPYKPKTLELKKR